MLSFLRRRRSKWLLRRCCEFPLERPKHREQLEISRLGSLIREATAATPLSGCLGITSRYRYCYMLAAVTIHGGMSSSRCEVGTAKVPPRGPQAVQRCILSCLPDPARELAVQ